VRVLWTRSAVGDLDGISDAARQAIVDRVGLLAEYPMLGPAMDGRYAGYRQLLVGRYRVIYAIAGDEVRIAYVRHGARQLGLRVVRSAPDDETDE
jgi:plasmid stabilization system protein ParE